MNKLKSELYALYQQFYLFLLYIMKHPLSQFILLAGILLTYGRIAFATDYYVDSEVVINIPGTSYNWLEIGRYGLVFTKKLLGTSWYNPYYTGILLLLFLWLTGITMTYLFGKLFPKLPHMMLTFGSLVFLTYPTFTEQYYFHFQSAEIAFGLWLTMMSMGLLYGFTWKGQKSFFLLSIPLYVLVFSIYQSFIPMALCGYLVLFVSRISLEDCDVSFYQRSIIGSIAHFLLAFGISQGINSVFFESSSYLTDQVIWSEASGLESILAIATACFNMFIGRGIFYTSLLLFAVLFALVAIFMLYKQRGSVPCIWTSLAVLGITIVPFLLTMLLGTTTSVRTQFVYGFSAMALIYVAATVLSWKTALCTTLVALVSIGQICTVNLIWNIHTTITEFDKAASAKLLDIFYDSFALSGGGSPMLWGYLQPETKYDEIISKSPSYLFLSVYNLEHATEPYCYFSTIRALGYLESTGHKFTLPTHATQSMSAYFMEREALSAFPETGCYFQDVNSLTVNLGNCPEYYYQ